MNTRPPLRSSINSISSDKLIGIFAPVAGNSILVRGPQLVGDYHFDTGAGWIIIGGTISIAASNLIFLNSLNTDFAYRAVNCLAGKTFELVVFCSEYTVGEVIVYYDDVGLGVVYVNSVGIKSIRFIGTGIRSFYLQGHGGSSTLKIDWVTVNEIREDEE